MTREKLKFLMPLHLNTQADLEDAIHALVKLDPRLQAGI